MSNDGEEQYVQDCDDEIINREAAREPSKPSSGPAAVAPGEEEEDTLLAAALDIVKGPGTAVELDIAVVLDTAAALVAMVVDIRLEIPFEAVGIAVGTAAVLEDRRQDEEVVVQRYTSDFQRCLDPMECSAPSTWIFGKAQG